MKGEKKGYKVVVQSGIEGISFPDLFIRNKDGTIRQIAVKKDRFIPTAQIDPKMLQQSLDIGCLGRALRKRWVVEERIPVFPEMEQASRVIIGQIEPGVYGPIELVKKQEVEVPTETESEPETKSKSEPELVTEPEIEDKYFCTKCEKSHKVDSNIGKKHVEFNKVQNVKEEVPEPVSSKPVVRKQKRVKVKKNVTFDTVSSYEDFQSLLFFSKLKYLNKGSKLDVIEDVYYKSDNNQLKNNAKLRLIREKKL